MFEHFVCFHSNVFGYVKDKAIPLKVGLPTVALHAVAALLLCICTPSCTAAPLQQRPDGTAGIHVLEAMCQQEGGPAMLMSVMTGRAPAHGQEVTAVRKRKNVGFPNSIEITWGPRHRREFFTSFLSREDAFRLIMAAWHQSAPEKAEAQMFSSKARKRESLEDHLPHTHTWLTHTWLTGSLHGSP